MTWATQLEKSGFTRKQLAIVRSVVKDAEAKADALVEAVSLYNKDGLAALKKARQEAVESFVKKLKKHLKRPANKEIKQWVEYGLVGDNLVEDLGDVIQDVLGDVEEIANRIVREEVELNNRKET